MLTYVCIYVRSTLYLHFILLLLACYSEEIWGKTRWKSIYFIWYICMYLCEHSKGRHLSQSRSLPLRCEDEEPAGWKDGWWCGEITRTVSPRHPRALVELQAPRGIPSMSGLHLNPQTLPKDNCRRGSQDTDVCEAAASDVSRSLV